VKFLVWSTYFSDNRIELGVGILKTCQPFTEVTGGMVITTGKNVAAIYQVVNLNFETVVVTLEAVDVAFEKNRVTNTGRLELFNLVKKSGINFTPFFKSRSEFFVFFSLFFSLRQRFIYGQSCHVSFAGSSNVSELPFIIFIVQVRIKQSSLCHTNRFDILFDNQQLFYRRQSDFADIDDVFGQISNAAVALIANYESDQGNCNEAPHEFFRQIHVFKHRISPFSVELQPVTD